ncbi:MAG TPA: signal recognition particle receptor subunit alpha, partial [Coriobacteriia bacterium]|nr:signal recognition particle receptor subunit alpha [Coriobacteriia bacterium]
MITPWFSRVSEGLSRSRERFQGQINILLRRGPDLDDGFWEDLEDILVGADLGAAPVAGIVDRLRESAARLALPDADAVLGRLEDELAREFSSPLADPFEERP